MIKVKDGLNICCLTDNQKYLFSMKFVKTKKAQFLDYDRF